MSVHMKIPRAWFLNLLLFLSCSGLLIACHHSSPEQAAMQSLTERSLSVHYTAAFWATEKEQQHSPLWQEAVEYCSTRSPRDFPNCQFIYDLKTSPRKYPWALLIPGGPPKSPAELGEETKQRDKTSPAAPK
jgi:hypothetical protein